MTRENELLEKQRWAELRLEAFERLQKTNIVIGTSIFASNYYTINLGYPVAYLRAHNPKILGEAVAKALILIADDKYPLSKVFKILNTNLLNK